MILFQLMLLLIIIIIIINYVWLFIHIIPKFNFVYFNWIDFNFISYLFGFDQLRAVLLIYVVWINYIILILVDLIELN